MIQTGQKSKNLGSLYSLRDTTRYLTIILEYSLCKNGDIQCIDMLFARQLQLKQFVCSFLIRTPDASIWYISYIVFSRGAQDHNIAIIRQTPKILLRRE